MVSIRLKLGRGRIVGVDATEPAALCAIGRARPALRLEQGFVGQESLVRRDRVVVIGKSPDFADAKPVGGLDPCPAEGQEGDFEPPAGGQCVALGRLGHGGFMSKLWAMPEAAYIPGMRSRAPR